MYQSLNPLAREVSATRRRSVVLEVLDIDTSESVALESKSVDGEDMRSMRGRGVLEVLLLDREKPKIRGLMQTRAESWGRTRRRFSSSYLVAARCHAAK